MYIHEYQAKELLSARGIAVPAGEVADTPEQAAENFKSLHLKSAMVKAQIHAGGRGKAGGIIAVTSADEASEAARRLLGRKLVTPQTGPAGRVVKKILVQERVDLAGEFYLGISIDRSRGLPVVTASPKGGMEIESLAKNAPGTLIREHADPTHGIESYQARNICAAFGLPHDRQKQGAEMILALAKTFIELDCSLIEINPLGLLADGRLIAVDVKMSFDDNALFRHPEIAALRDESQEDPREVEADRSNLSYVGLEGNIGCMVNGAGLAMATLDLIRSHGGEPANFLDVGGDATAEKVAAAFQIISQDQRVTAIMINIFGGIVRCDVVADGIIAAARQSPPHIPLVVRLEGNLADEGRKKLAAAGLKITLADSLEDAAAKAVSAARSAR